jgi:uncharacterized protein involved in outer membrane biogenesis
VRRPWQTILIIATVAIVFLLIALASVVPFSSEVARSKVIEVLADRLDSEVQLDSLDLRVLPRLRAEGVGLTIRHKGRQDVPPLISVEKFAVEGNVFSLLGRHISIVTLEGLNIQIPPGGAAAAIKGDGNKTADQAGADAGSDKRAYVIDNLVTTDAKLVIVPRMEGKAPKVWAIHDLRMRGVAFDRAMPFEATLTNGIPPGEIVTRGSFGPWSRDEPGETPLDGTFTFDEADLSVFNGISGILSAKGDFGGRLERIEVHGDTDTPQFTITSVGHAIPLRAKYHAIVDGTNGDTILERIDGSFLNTSLVAKGDVTDLPGAPGRQVNLELTMDSARLEDVLWLAVKTPKPPMTGALTLKTIMILPPGKVDVIEKLRLDGKFSIDKTRFTDPDIQKKIEGLSQRSRGIVSAQPAAQVTSDFTGSFKLADGVLTIPSVAFDIPGSVVRLSGNYAIKPEVLDFRGTLFMDAKISETMTGFKSLLLKAVDPLFRGEKGGSAIPIRISGARNNPSFGLDKGRIFKRES